MAKLAEANYPESLRRIFIINGDEWEHIGWIIYSF